MAEPRPLHVVTTAVSVRLQVPAPVFEEALGLPAATLGQRLAERVDLLTRERGLGYYPALDYVIQSDGLGTDLLGDLERVSGCALEYTAREIPRRLKPVFSSVQLRGGQFAARTLPSVRPGQPDAIAALGRHYTPDTIRLELNLGTILRGPSDGLERVTAQKVLWWLREHFVAIDIVDARLIER